MNRGSSNLKSTKEEALSLLGKWKTELTPLFCFVNLPPLRVALERVTVESFGSGGVTVRSSDREGKVSLAFSKTVVFNFGDSRLVPSEVGTFDAGLAILLDESAVSKNEGLILLERRTA